MRPRTSPTSDPSPIVWFSCRNVFRVCDEPLRVRVRVRVRVSDVTARASAPRCFICLPLTPTSRSQKKKSFMPASLGRRPVVCELNMSRGSLGSRAVELFRVVSEPWRWPSCRT